MSQLESRVAWCNEWISEQAKLSAVAIVHELRSEPGTGSLLVCRISSAIYPDAKSAFVIGRNAIESKEWQSESKSRWQAAIELLWINAMNRGR